MIQKIELKFGSTQNGEPLEIDVTPITIFVGPNNSGKSKVLAEIQKFCDQGTAYEDNVILNNIFFSLLTDPEAEINKYTLSPNMSDMGIEFGKRTKKHRIGRHDLLDILKNPSTRKITYCQYYVSFNTIRIDGASRMSLIDSEKFGDLQGRPLGNLSVLFKENEKRKEVRRITYDAFKKYFIIDPTNLGQLRIRLSETEPIDEIQEKGIHENAIEFHRKALEITKASDGIKAFIGIITTIIAGDPKVILIDEPEAFLHPSLASKLGKEVSNSVNGTFKNLFVSTHSANFLMGCIQSGVPINIVRLTYSNNTSTARILPSEKILKLMRHPLLRSTGVLNGLFYEYVIVTEADSDRAFYQEINERLLTFSPSNGIPNCLFLNAQNKQTIHEILRPLREMGIPCAAIVDIDVIKEGGNVWSNLLSSAFIPDLTISSTADTRARLKNKFEETKKNYKRDGGVDVLASDDKEACNNLFNQLDEYGIFVVRNGELESWLKNLGNTSKHGPDWLIEIFEKIGEDPASEGYIKPGTGDIWDFMLKINTWFSNPLKKGTPE